MRCLTVILAIGLLSSVTTVTLAQAPVEEANSAEEHSRRGVEFYAAGKLPEAVREMLKAYELAPEPGLLYNIARIYQKMGERDLAMHYFKKFVTLDGADPDRVQKALQHLEELKNARPAPTVSSPLPEPTVVESPPHAAVKVAPEASKMSADGIGWTLVSVGGAVVAAGAVLGVLALDSAAELDDPILLVDEKIAVQQSAQNMALGADIALITGTAVAATGLILLLLSDDEEQAVVLTPSFGPDHTSAYLTVRFP